MNQGNLHSEELHCWPSGALGTAHAWNVSLAMPRKLSEGLVLQVNGLVKWLMKGGSRSRGRKFIPRCMDCLPVKCVNG